LKRDGLRIKARIETKGPAVELLLNKSKKMLPYGSILKEEEREKTVRR